MLRSKPLIYHSKHPTIHHSIIILSYNHSPYPCGKAFVSQQSRQCSNEAKSQRIKNIGQKPLKCTGTVRTHREPHRNTIFPPIKSGTIKQYQLSSQNCKSRYDMYDLDAACSQPRCFTTPETKLMHPGYEQTIICNNEQGILSPPLPGATNIREKSKPTK